MHVGGGIADRVDDRADLVLEGLRQARQGLVLGALMFFDVDGDRQFHVEQDRPGDGGQLGGAGGLVGSAQPAALHPLQDTALQTGHQQRIAADVPAGRQSKPAVGLPDAPDGVDIAAVVGAIGDPQPVLELRAMGMIAVLLRREQGGHFRVV